MEETSIRRLYELKAEKSNFGTGFDATKYN